MLLLTRILLLMVLENNMCTFSHNPHFYVLSDLAGLWYLFQKLLCCRSNVRSFNVPLDLFSVSLFLLQDNGVNIPTISYWVKNTSKYIIYSIIYSLWVIYLYICVCVCINIYRERDRDRRQREEILYFVKITVLWISVHFLMVEFFSKI